jgi:soluble lytic murein transglycosylase-like protein
MIARRTRSGWKTGSDYRVICDCQVHRQRERSLWRRAGRIASRSVAVLISVPLAITAFDLPIAAMNIKSVNLDALRVSTPVSALVPAAVPEAAPGPKLEVAAPGSRSSLPIFTTDSVREQFLAQPVSHSLDVIKEHYFRTRVPYGAIIYREARRNGLAPELVAAMVHTESDFRPGLVSNKSAQGLMQIVPETARVLGIANPFDPEENIAAGTRYFRYLLKRFNGNEQIALAAYNAGPTNVERFGGVPPFPETQAYIEKVNVRRSRYRARLRTTYVATVRMADGIY